MRRNQPFEKNIPFGIGVFCTILEGILSASVYAVIYLLVRLLFQDNVTVRHLNQLTILVIGIFGLRLIVYGFGYTQGQIGGGAVSKRIRLFLGDKFKKIPLRRFQQGQIGQYVNVMTSDINNYQQILTHKIGNLVKNISLSLMLLIFACYLYLPAGIILIGVSLLFVPNMWLSFQIVKKYGNARNTICAEAVSAIVEYISGIRTLRTYNMSGEKNKAITSILQEYSNISYKYEAMGIPAAFLFHILTWLSFPAVMVVAAKSWLSGDLSAVDYLMTTMMPMLLAKLYMTISVDLFGYKNMLISKEKIKKIVFEPEEQGSRISFETNAHDISFENVQFSYIKGETVLKDISFCAENQKLTAIVGESGSGKSTILNLIAKYYEADNGSIAIGGKEIKNIEAEQVLKNIAIVEQDVFLFDDTVRENIRHARPDASDEEIEQACKEANCDTFVQKMEKGYDTLIGENGNFLSGGERQRLSIARAILKNTPILLLDEAVASLDIENELAVKQAIINLLKRKKTVIMIAHTLSVIKNADKILVLSKGEIIESGTHSQLLENEGKYAAMWKAEKGIVSSKG